MSSMRTPPPDQLVRLVADIRTSAKYAAIMPQLVERIGAQELAKGRSYKVALKATKNRLHQIAAVYLSRRPAYEEWLAQLKQAKSNPTATRQICRAIMAHHASTRERLPILDTFYATLFRDLSPIHSLQDLACGLNPLTVPWMLDSGVLAADFSYWAYDVYRDLAEFLQAFFTLSATSGRATTLDLLHETPQAQSDVALLFKAIPCLEQVAKETGRRLLEQINAQTLFVSYPVQSLGGRNRGMVQFYTSHFYQMVQNSAWRVERFEFDAELVFRIQK